jgi:hypothetical protein
MNPKLEKFLRYLSAYAWYIFFILLGFAISMGLRSDVFLLCLVTGVPKWISNLIYVNGTFILFIPFVVSVAGLESYMNGAARKCIVRQRALRVLAIEGVIGVVVLLVMAGLALAGYPPAM